MPASRTAPYRTSFFAPYPTLKGPSITNRCVPPASAAERPLSPASSRPSASTIGGVGHEPSVEHLQYEEKSQERGPRRRDRLKPIAPSASRSKTRHFAPSAPTTHPAAPAAPPTPAPVPVSLSRVQARDEDEDEDGYEKRVERFEKAFNAAWDYIYGGPPLAVNDYTAPRRLQLRVPTPAIQSESNDNTNININSDSDDYPYKNNAAVEACLRGIPQ